jgi:hypothetical protein
VEATEQLYQQLIDLRSSKVQELTKRLCYLLDRTRQVCTNRAEHRSGNSVGNLQNLLCRRCERAARRPRAFGVEYF